MHNVPQTPQQVTIPAAHIHTGCDDDGLKRRQCFVIVSTLKYRFVQKGISENGFWCWALGTQGKNVIGSRSQFEEYDWTFIAARLAAAQDNVKLFDALCEQIHQQGNCRVYRINSDLSEIKVYDGLFEKSVYERCQPHADKTGCTVRLHAYSECESFEPKDRKLDQNTPPISDNPKGVYPQ